MKRKLLLGIVVLSLLLGSGYGVYATFGAGRATADLLQATPTPSPAAAVKAGDTVVVEAAVTPLQSVNLHFTANNIVNEVLVKEGDSVKKGAPLARLDTRTLKLNLEKVRVALQQAQARYSKLEAGATPEEIEAAQAQVAQAQAQLQQTQGSVTNSDIAAARSQLQSARAALAKLEAGPKSSEVTAAKAALTQARTQLSEVQSGPKSSDVAAAKAALDQAKANLAHVQKGPKSSEVQAAQAALDQVKANRDTQAASLSTAKTRAQSQMEQIANDVRLAQEAYTKAFWDHEQAKSGVNPKTGRKFSEEGLDEQTQQRQYDEALRVAALKLEQAQQALDQAKLAYEQARQAEISGVAAADAQVAQAQANLDKVITSIDEPAVVQARAQVAQAQANLDKLLRIDPAAVATAKAQVAQAQANLDKLLRVEPSELAAARAQVAQAEANLARLQGTERKGSIAAAAAGVENAQANLEKVTSKAGEPDLAAALADVEQAKVVIKEAELALDQATLRAPISGTVAELNIKVGEVPATGGPAVVLADFSQWQIETTDLTELNVVNIKVGDTVTMTFDALPGVELPGKVTRIKPIGKNKQGDITYTVIVTPTQQDERLRWNMTASVVITPTKK